MFIEFHVLQNFTVSNLNRDDTGTPKDCTFGGFRRARISSQCAKRAIRRHEQFVGTVVDAGGNLGNRTKRLVKELVDRIPAASFQPDVKDALSVAEVLVEGLGLAFGKKDNSKAENEKFKKTQYLLFLGEEEISKLGVIMREHWDDLKEIAHPTTDSKKDDGQKKDKKKRKKEKKQAIPKEIRDKLKRVFGPAKTLAADVALFGRMVADDKNLNIDAACQVAHAISTNEVEMKMDFFTAVDDLLPDEEQGSDMMGFVEYNSSCYYRYALINMDILKKNLGYDPERKETGQGQWHDPALVKATVEGFARAMCEAVPSGMQNSMAAHNPLSYMRVIVRSGGSPWNLANAFVQPVRSWKEEGKDLINLSVKKLETYYNNLKNAFDKNGNGIALDKIFSHNLRERKDDIDFSQFINELGKIVLKEAKA
ncbi:MAG: type I-E CRISPR-associated protein Cas7/Cse4/CasC [Deltaproteobacteria bacterium]|nr:type I-E CRISPR-associated protein Cas7/Cse4/CasC [Deltaproteobacteria bacterium]